MDNDIPLRLRSISDEVDAVSGDLAETAAGIRAAADVVEAWEAPTTPADADPRYRCQTRHLFQPVAVKEIPPRLPGQKAYKVETSGPTKLAVDALIGWLWTTPGGDTTGPFASIGANGYPKGSPGGWYEIDATVALLEALWQKRPWAFLLHANVDRTMRMRESATPPELHVTRADGSEYTVPVWVTTSANATSPAQLLQEAQMPMFVEFERPQVDPAPTDVASARIRFYVAHHNGLSSKAVFTLHLLTPDISLPPVEQGIAAAYPGDVGIEDHPSVIVVQQYADGDDETLYMVRGTPNIEAARNYSPDVFDLAKPADLMRYPHAYPKRWLNISEHTSIVPSTAVGDGFVPFRPGYGALEVSMPKDDRAVEGGLVYSAGTLASRLEMPLPFPLIGRQPTIGIRYGFQWCVPDGEPEELPLSAILAVWKGVNPDGSFHSPDWTSIGGKQGIVGTHNTTVGGFSGSSGGGYGWQNRLLQGRILTGRPGPQSKGIYFGFHLGFDFQGRRHPLGKSGAGIRIPEQGGRIAGVLYPNKWYTIETLLKLNSVDQPGILADGSLHKINGVQQYWAEDGELTLWLDGRRAWHQDKLIFRTLPLAGIPPTYDPNTSSLLYALGDLGVRSLLLNIFDGGVTPSTARKVIRHTGLVVTDGTFIGPMAAG